MIAGHLKGIVEEVGSRGRVKVRLPELDGVITDWLPVVQSLTLGAKTWMVPRKGTQVVVLPGLGLEDAVVMGSLYSQADPAPFQNPAILGIEADDGTQLTYDPVSKMLKISKPDSIMFDTRLFNVTGDFVVNGKALLGDEVHVKGKATLDTKLSVAGKDFATHTHTDPQGGKTGPVA